MARLCMNIRVAHIDSVTHLQLTNASSEGICRCKSRKIWVECVKRDMDLLCLRQDCTWICEETPVLVNERLFHLIIASGKPKKI